MGAPSSFKKSGIKKVFLLLAIAIPIAVGVVFGILWYQALPLKTARYYRESGDLPAALASVDEYLGEYPNDVDGLSLKAQILCQQGRYQEAADIYLEIGPASEEDFVCFTESLVALQMWGMAVSTSDLYAANDRFPPNPQIYLWGVISHANLGELDAALDSADRLARIEGRESHGLLLYGELKLRQGARQDAVKAWEKVLELNPKAEDFHIPAELFFENYVSALTSLGRLEDALKVLDSGLAVSNSSNLHFLKGNILKDLNRIQDAKQEWMMANVGGDHPGAHLALATQLLAEGEAKKAAMIMGRLASRDFMDSRYAFVMNNICEALDDKENAAKWNEIFQALSREERVENVMSQVISDQPRNPWSLVFQAYFHAKEARWDMAQRMLASVQSEMEDEEAYQVLKKAVDAKQFVPEILTALEEKGIGISQ